ncbi:MAG TPA: ATP-binding protein [Prolixibacteraceae bacterium]|nr:ATP-binding protein [Prolixibacteraceae bacterium]
MKNRRLKSHIEQSSRSKTGRIIVFTGARQTGKTTLSRHLFPDYTYLSIDDPVLRNRYKQLTAMQWYSQFPKAILDEVQKEPELIESIKSVYDQWPEPRYILLGSSQFLLLEKVKESLAGRCLIFDLYPLTIPELCTNGWDDVVMNSVFQNLVKGDLSTDQLLSSFLFDEKMVSKNKAWVHYSQYGAYPAVADKELSDTEKRDWLKNYVRTYLERDLRDLASFRELEPFQKLQHYLAQNTGNLVNASAIANQIGVSAKTVSRYINYFEISYQAILLQSWSRNKNKRLVKTPKIHYLDNGIVQAILQKYGSISGNEFESLVIAEMYKQLKNIQAPVNFYHLRTHDGKEIDLIIELPNGYYAFEIKMTDKVRAYDARHFSGLSEILDKPLLHSFLISNDYDTTHFNNNTTAINVAYFLG